MQFDEKDFQLRTKQLYEEHCIGLDGPLRDHIATTYGLQCNSVLNECSYFHVTDGLVPDVMHDVLEGTLEITVRHCLWHLVREEGLFSLTLLNERIRTFSYGPDISNKPSEIAALNLDTAIKQSGI